MAVASIRTFTARLAPVAVASRNWRLAERCMTAMLYVVLKVWLGMGAFNTWLDQRFRVAGTLNPLDDVLNKGVRTFDLGVPWCARCSGSPASRTAPCGCAHSQRPSKLLCKETGARQAPQSKFARTKCGGALPRRICFRVPRCFGLGQLLALWPHHGICCASYFFYVTKQSFLHSRS